MSNKLELLKQYAALQAMDDGLWFFSQSASEAYLQQELRRVMWLIEEATEEQIKNDIERYAHR